MKFSFSSVFALFQVGRICASTPRIPKLPGNDKFWFTYEGPVDEADVAPEIKVCSLDIGCFP